MWGPSRILMMFIKKESKEVLTAYENPTKSVEDVQKIVDANEKLVKELKDGDK